MKNKLQILLVEEERKIIKYNMYFILNGAKEVFSDKFDSRTFQVSTYRKTFMDFFLKNLPYFILKNYDYDNEFIDIESGIGGVFRFEKGLNYISDLMKQIPILLEASKKKNKIILKLDNELDYVTIERLIVYRKSSIRHRAKINELFNMDLIESDFPEYFL